jgi:ABC-type sugar transport system substrate-binding protein
MNSVRFLSAALLLIVLPGCQSDGGRSGAIYVLLPSTSNPFWQEVRRGAEEASAELPSTPVFVRAGAFDTDASQQVQVMRQILDSERVAALVIGPASATEIVPTVARFNRANIPVIVIDSRLSEEDLRQSGAHMDGFVGSPNERGAALAAEYIRARVADSSRVLLLAGSPVHETAHLRSRGFKDAAPTGWHIEERTANWSRMEANRLARALGGEVMPDAVFASNDEMALGFVEGLKGMGLTLERWPIIVGFDATPDGRAAVMEGTLCASIAQNPRELGRQGVAVARQILADTADHPLERMVDLSVVSSNAERCRPGA